MPFYRFTLTDPYHVEVCSLLRLWLKKTIREPDTAERHLQLCHVSQSTRSVTRWFGSPNPRWKKKKEHFCVFVFKGIGLHPPALFFLPWTRVYNSSWLLNRWSRWNVQEIHSRASCLNNEAEGSAPVPCQPRSNWQYISRFLKTFYKKEKKKKRSQTTTTKGKRKRATPEHPPAPIRLRFLFHPWNNYKETFQAKYLVLMVSHCSTSQPRPFPFYV